jgi:hypothetical protein
MGIGGFRAEAAQNQTNTGKPEEKDEEKKIRFHDEKNQARYHKNQVSVDPDKLQFAHGNLLFPQELNEIIKWLNDGRTIPTLHARRYPTVYAKKQTTNDRSTD